VLAICHRTYSRWSWSIRCAVPAVHFGSGRRGPLSVPVPVPGGQGLRYLCDPTRLTGVLSVRHGRTGRIVGLVKLGWWNRAS
jgi:hypothetical protein